MSVSFYSIPKDKTDCMKFIKNALEERYGEDLVVHYFEGEYLIFSCVAIADKVIKIARLNDNRLLAFFYGDAWDSGSTITNQLAFAGPQGDDDGRPENIVLLLGDSFMLLQYNKPVNASYTSLILIGQLTNGTYIVCGNCLNSGYGLCLNTTTVKPLSLLVFNQNFGITNGERALQDVYFCVSNFRLEENEDGSLATIPGIKNISLSLSPDKFYVDVLKFISGSGYYSNSKASLPTSLYVALTDEDPGGLL